jgi:hypothetical protein
MGMGKCQANYSGENKNTSKRAQLVTLFVTAMPTHSFVLDKY